MQLSLRPILKRRLQPQLSRSGSQTILAPEVSPFALSACLGLESVLHLAFTYAAEPDGRNAF